MREFKFFRGSVGGGRLIPIPGGRGNRRYVGVQPGVLNAMTLPMGRLYYMEARTNDFGGGNMGEINMELMSTAVSTNTINVQSINWFIENNSNNYIWLYQWRTMDNDNFINFADNRDIPNNTPLYLRCVIRTN